MTDLEKQIKASLEVLVSKASEGKKLVYGLGVMNTYDFLMPLITKLIEQRDSLVVDCIGHPESHAVKLNIEIRNQEILTLLKGEA